ncbi:MAG: sulfotransferase [Anaerolineales bacterium]|nr:sulfotransferase [Anaerolineales bacterium]
MNNAPILVTGAHRSGTTWVGKMLAANPQTAYLSEPLNVLHRPGVFHAPVKFWYLHIHAQNEAEYLPAFRNLLSYQYDLPAEIKSLRSRKDLLRMGRDWFTFVKGKTYNQTPLLKDPFALFSIPWFIQKLNCRVIVTVRHPAGFASSLKRLNWSFDFQNLLNQPSLMQILSATDRAEMLAASPNDVIGQAALLWKLIYRFAHAARSLFPSIQLVRHEDLSLNPLVEYENLYRSLNLEFTAQVKDTILNSSASENPTRLAKNKTHSVKLDSKAAMNNWKQLLTAEETNRIRQMTEGVSQLFYAAEDWK